MSGDIRHLGPETPPRQESYIPMAQDGMLGGAVVVRQGDSMVLVTATASKQAKDLDFFPLTVDFEERMYAAGKLPGGFIKRESRPSEKATLTARMIDRPIRSSFADGFRNEVQVIATVLSADQVNQPDVISIMGASSALLAAGIPFEGPLAGVRICRDENGEFLVNPSFEEAEASDLDLVVAGSKDAVYMLEAGAKEVTEEDMLAALMFAQEAIGKFCEVQESFLAKIEITPMDVQLQIIDPELKDAIFKKATYVDTDGATSGIVGVVVDITEQKQAELAIRELNEVLARKAADLEAANRELESFSYSVTHDLRKPLTIIYTAAQALRDECRIEGDETAAYFIQTICDGSRRMDELIEALQVLTHVSRSGMTVAIVDLSMLAEEIFADLRQMAPERAIVWEVPPRITAVGDPRLLRVLLENLLGNAWKYTSKCREARISFGVAQTPRGEAYFVRDNGAGFDMALAGELFKPFVRLHNPREFPGTGVGLATVHRIVERHGGRVWAESAVGDGATFYFTLPEPQPQLDERSGGLKLT